MEYSIYFIICFIASVIGAICGIGGGVIIKPVLDVASLLGVAEISFLSGCTVLSMAAYSVVRSRMGGRSGIEPRIGVLLSIGAVLGGIIGKWLFSYVKEWGGSPDFVGMVQAVCLLVVTSGTLIYTLRKERISTRHTDSKLLCVVIGIILGIMSSFLGIGGGPINLVVLFYFFSMTTKQAAENSLYIILFSQTANLLSGIITCSIPQVSARVLVVMVVGGILGGMCGRSLNKRIREQTVDKLFVGVMIGMIMVNMYNIYKFM